MPIFKWRGAAGGNVSSLDAEVLEQIEQTSLDRAGCCGSHVCLRCSRRSGHARAISASINCDYRALSANFRFTTPVSERPMRSECADIHGSMVRADSPLEERGFEPSVPRDTTKLSMSPLIGSPPTESRSEREPTHEASGPSPTEPMVRIRLPPAASLLPTRIGKTRSIAAHKRYRADGCFLTCHRWSMGWLAVAKLQSLNGRGCCSQRCAARWCRSSMKV
jgi:hypothetical protein